MLENTAANRIPKLVIYSEACGNVLKHTDLRASQVPQDSCNGHVCELNHNDVGVVQALTIISLIRGVVSQ